MIQSTFSSIVGDDGRTNMDRLFISFSLSADAVASWFLSRHCAVYYYALSITIFIYTSALCDRACIADSEKH